MNPKDDPPDPRGARLELSQSVGAFNPRRLGRALLLKPGEGRVFLLSAAYFFFVLSAYYMIRPIREQLGLAGGVWNLPWLMTATLVVMLALNPVYAWVVARLPRRRFIPLVYRFFAANLLIFFALIVSAPESWSIWIGRAFYVWTSVFNLFVVSVFWSVMVDTHSSEQAKRLFGAIGVGGTLGAITGAALTGWLVTYTGKAPLMLGSIVLLEAALFAFRRIAARGALDGVTGTGIAREPGTDPIAGFKLLIRSPYLAGIALYLLLFAVTGTQLYMMQMEIVDVMLPEDAQQTRFFANLDIATNACTLLLQAFVTGRFVMLAGVAAALALVPLLTLGGFAALLMAPTLLVVAGFQVLRRALHYAVDRPAREALFTPLSPDEKYKTKAFIDTFVYRAGDAVGVWTKPLMLALFPAASAATVVAMVLAALWFGLGVALGIGFRRRTAGAAPPSASR